MFKAEGELGCSDIQGWVERGGQEAAPPMQVTTTPEAEAKIPKKERVAVAGTQPRVVEDKVQPKTTATQTLVPAVDGSDDYLHYPLKGAPLQKGQKITTTGPDSSIKDKDDVEHGDIQSLQESAEIAGKVVLLSRGGCGFLEKVKWVQRRGGVALIVGDNVRNGALVNMYANGDTSNVTIPSMFTSYTSAHLLSSLVPPGGLFNGIPFTDDPLSRQGTAPKGQSIKAKSKKGKATTIKGTTSKAMGTQTTGSNDKDAGILRKFANAISLGEDTLEGNVDDKSRYPSNGRVSWVQSDNWEDEPSSKQAQKDGKVSGSASASTHGFVIGVHDWRDPDLVFDKEQNEEVGDTTSTKTAPASTKTQSSDSKAAGTGNGQVLSGGNTTPGSGTLIPAHGAVPATTAEFEESSDQEKSNWLGRIFSSSGSAMDDSSADEGIKSAKTAASQFIADQGYPDPGILPVREGLWVTITPTIISRSPFFDTLLVLVVSPLVTLTFVYATLILRARIQRRRWRAPKSVVERLPVHVYHTMASSCSTSSHTPSIRQSAATPLLQNEHTSTLTRTRPRSYTTTSVLETVSAALDQEPIVGSPSSRGEKLSTQPKKYRGRQIECVVCLEEYIDGQSQVMSLPCGHEFHAECM